MEKEISSKELIRFIEKITKLEPIYFIPSEPFLFDHSYPKYFFVDILN